MPWAAAGITQGCTATEYCPNEFVTRDQMAAFLLRALGWHPLTTTARSVKCGWRRTE